ncbi:hypothetical protein Ancab_036123 [Ancistrocladus abbreviatus]
MPLILHVVELIELHRELNEFRTELQKIGKKKKAFPTSGCLVGHYNGEESEEGGREIEGIRDQGPSQLASPKFVRRGSILGAVDDGRQMPTHDNGGGELGMVHARLVTSRFQRHFLVQQQTVRVLLVRLRPGTGIRVSRHRAKPWLCYQGFL